MGFYIGPCRLPACSRQHGVYFAPSRRLGHRAAGTGTPLAGAQSDAPDLEPERHSRSAVKA